MLEYKYITGKPTEPQSLVSHSHDLDHNVMNLSSC